MSPKGEDPSFISCQGPKSQQRQPRSKGGETNNGLTRGPNSPTLFCKGVPEVPKQWIHFHEGSLDSALRSQLGSRLEASSAGGSLQWARLL